MMTTQSSLDPMTANTATNLAAALHLAALGDAAKPALICQDRLLTFGELERRTTALAAGLAAQGVIAGDRVALLFNNSFELPLCLMACWKRGAIAVPVNTRFAAPEIEFIVEHSAARLLIGERARCQALNSAALPEAVIEVPALEADTGQPVLDRLIRSAAVSSDEAAVRVDDDPPALIIYTSGSTARPKGVVHTRHSLALATAALFPEAPRPTRVCVMTPLFHISGLFLWTLALAEAATAVLMPGFEAGSVLDTIERYRCEATLGLPLLYRPLLEAQRARPRGLSCCTGWYAGGDSIDEELQTEWSRSFPHPLTEGYGLTELCPAVGNVPGQTRVGSFGRAAPGVEARICDESGRELADGETGQLLLRAPHLFRGYWQDPESTAAALRDGWFWTGDLAARTADGFFHFQGRLKLLIVRGGAKIAPQEVEAVLVQHPGIAEAAVVGRPDPVLGETVAAFIVRQPGQHPTARELTEFGRARLAAYKVPETFFSIDALPRSPTGKADRRYLREHLLRELIPLNP